MNEEFNYYRELCAHDRFVREHEAKAAAEAERARQAEAERAREQLRTPAYAAAEAAARRAGAETSSSLIRMLLDAVVERAIDTPQIRLVWLVRGTKSGSLVGADNALAFVRADTVAVWPIADLVSASVALHEIGHCRQPNDRKLLGELTAWTFSRAHMPAWDETCEASMRAAIGTYVAHAEKLQILDVVAIEEFLAEDPALYRKPVALAIRDFEDREFLRLWGRRPCELRRWCRDQPDPIAVGKVAHRYACRQCLEVHRMNMDLAEMRAAREAQRGKTA